jgi:hypothetical protein
VNDAQARPVRFVLDTSAIAAFARGSIHVGEVLAEVADEDAVALLPLACLVEAVHGQRFASEEDARLDLLVGHPATEMLADDPQVWRSLAYTYDLVGSADAAAAALAAIDYGVSLLSRYPSRYAGLDGGGRLVLPLDE